MLHRPGKELEHLTPGTLDRLLFDDIPFLAGAQQEHDQFAKVLRDSGAEVVYLEDLNVTLIGRDDASRSANRKSMADLMQSAKEGSYVVVLDHEPNDFDAEAASSADLVLCGHTHGGQLFPLGYVGLLMGANDEFLGLSRRENTDFIVNSGIADWSIPFKTGCRAEYVIVEVTGK